MKNQGQQRQWVWVGIVAVITALIASILLFKGKTSGTAASKDEHAENEHGADEKGEQEHAAELAFTSKQLIEQGIQLAKVEQGPITQQMSYPAKVVVNTDQQAHVSPSFAGQVEKVNVELGQQVKKGQPLATLFVPDLVDQQANLKIAQENLTLAQQDYARERQLLTQGISARQDYQRAYNAYRQAQIAVQAARSRLSALGAGTNSQGRYTIYAPISGVVSNKDVVVGENVQLTDQLFTINQLDQLWLEFVLPASDAPQIQLNQKIEFKSLQTGQIFQAQVHSLMAEADTQSGRLKANAKILNANNQLRPNLMVNVLLTNPQPTVGLRVAKSAIQQVEGKQVVFVAETEKDKIHFKATPVKVGAYSGDGAWVEIQSGLTANQRYVQQGSFLLKSEMEKGEAEHGH